MAYYCMDTRFDLQNVAPYGKAGAALAVGDLVYLDSSGNYQLAAAGSHRALFVVIAAALQYESVSAVKVTTLKGFSGETIGSKAYLTTTGTTGNTISSTKPAGAPAQVVGIFRSATELFVNVDIGLDEEGPISIYGSDGKFKASYQTIDLAIAALASNDILKIKSGEYTLTDACDIVVAGVKIIGEGHVEINGASGADYMFKTVLGVQTGTKEIWFKNLTLNHEDDATQVGIQIDNTDMTKKLNVYVEDCDFNTGGGNSIDIDHPDATAAIRLYVNGGTIEGAVNAVPANAGDRFRFIGTTLRGGVVLGTDDIAAEIMLKNCILLHEGFTGGHSNSRLYILDSVTETDADPNAYALPDSSDDGSMTATIIPAS